MNSLSKQTYFGLPRLPSIRLASSSRFKHSFLLNILAVTACKLAADIVFVVDSSNGVSNRDFKAMKSFLIAVQKRFKIEELASRHGVVVYGSRAEMSIQMNRARNSTEFANAVNSLRPIGGPRASFRALELAESALYNPGNGTRRNAPKVVVMVTAGVESTSSNGAYLKQVAKRLKDRDVVVKVVGISSFLRQNDLLPLVASSADVFRPGSFDELEKEAEVLSDSICKSIGMCRFLLLYPKHTKISCASIDSRGYGFDFH